MLRLRKVTSQFPSYLTLAQFLKPNKDSSRQQALRERNSSMRSNNSTVELNFKVKLARGTSRGDIRYCDYESNLSQNTIFLLKYFQFECALCQRLTSHIWTGNCAGCKPKYERQSVELKGMCLDCCVQIEGCLRETGEELSECPLCHEELEGLYVCEEADPVVKALMAEQCRRKLQSMVEADPDAGDRTRR